MQLTLCCPTLFGLEGIVADELRFGGRLTDVHAENGRVLFTGDENTLAWANLNLRCAERVLIRIGTFKAKTFDQLFEGVKALPWEQFIPADGAFPVRVTVWTQLCTRFRTARRSSKGSCIASGRKVRSNLV
ncbi:MAG: THUMP domain-containing protein [Butyricicoccus sp.]